MDQEKGTSTPSRPKVRITPASGCALAVAMAAALGLIAPAIAVLMLQGEIVLGRGGLTETRVWLIRDSDCAGIGGSSSRFVQGGEAGPTACAETRVRFLLWRSDGSLQDAEYCDCYEGAADTWQLVGPCS